MKSLTQKSFLVHSGIIAALFICMIQASAADKADGKSEKAKEAQLTDAQIEEKMKAEAAAIAREQVTRESEEKDAEGCHNKATSYYREGKYEKAIELWLKAVSILDKQDDDIQIDLKKKKLNTYKHMIAKSYYFWAKELYLDAEKSANAGKYQEAIDTCKKAKEVYPLSEKVVNQTIEKYTRLRDSQVYKDKVSLKNVVPDISAYEDDMYKTEVLLKQGNVYFKAGMWAKARDKYNEVLAKDPYNETAIDSVRKCYLKLIDAGRARQKVLYAERNAESQWKSVAPIVVSSDSFDEAAAESATMKFDDSRDLQKKINDIRIPSLELEATPIKTVVSILKKLSKQYDPDPTSNGVNFVLRFNASANKKKSAAEDAGMEEGEGGEAAAPDAGGDESMEDGDMAAPPVAPKGEDDASGEEGEDGGAESEDVDGMEEPGDRKEKPVRSIDDTLITISVEDVSLMQAIQYVCRSVSPQLQCRIEKYAVVIAAPNVQLDELERRTFIVEKEVFDELGVSGGGDDKGDEVGSQQKSENVVKQFFVNRGVPFPPGARVKYVEGSSRLIVTNTAENLDKLDELIKELNVREPQVLVQVKFVEIDMNDLEELGFEYVIARPAPTDEVEDLYTPLYTNYQNVGGVPVNIPYYADNPFYLVYRPYETAGSSSGNSSSSNSSGSIGDATIIVPSTNISSQLVERGSYYQIPTNGEYYSVPVNLTQLYGKEITWMANDSLVRNAKTSASEFGSNTAAQDAVFQWSHYNDSGYSVEATIHALDQADSTDILSAPRVTTLSGQRAVIKMITEKYYPDSWSEAEISTISQNSGTGKSESIPVFCPSIPEFGDATEEGIVLQVEPTVEPDQYTVNLDMSPVIQEFVGWTDYSYEIPLGDEGKLYPNVLKMPIIEARTVRTRVQSYDNETVILGGVIRDRINIVDDQYPILGDLPLVGRLFQSKGHVSAKTNLLIFVNSRLIKPDGSPVREDVERGLPSIR